MVVGRSYRAVVHREEGKEVYRLFSGRLNREMGAGDARSPTVGWEKGGRKGFYEY
jgi:hypothetical protein